MHMADLEQQRRGFDTRLVQTVFVVNGLTLCQFLSEHFCFPLSAPIHHRLMLTAAICVNLTNDNVVTEYV
jgi:hypothetical protein